MYLVQMFGARTEMNVSAVLICTDSKHAMRQKPSSTKAPSKVCKRRLEQMLRLFANLMVGIIMRGGICLENWHQLQLLLFAGRGNTGAWSVFGAGGFRVSTTTEHVCACQLHTRVCDDLAFPTAMLEKRRVMTLGCFIQGTPCT